jgi:hypothetical protein
VALFVHLAMQAQVPTLAPPVVTLAGLVLTTHTRGLVLASRAGQVLAPVLRPAQPHATSVILAPLPLTMALPRATPAPLDGMHKIKDRPLVQPALTGSIKITSVPPLARRAC